MLTYRYDPSTASPDRINAHGASDQVRQINGRKLARKLRHDEIPPDQRARLAEDLRTGELHISNLTSAQARRIAGASVADVALVRRLARAKRRRGARLTDNDIDILVERIGAGRIFQALDRATRPTNGGGS